MTNFFARSKSLLVNEFCVDSYRILLISFSAIWIFFNGQLTSKIINPPSSRICKSISIDSIILFSSLSFFTITDGKNYLNFGSAQDYKRIGDNNTGPNTGGMGTVSPAPILNDELMEKIQSQIIEKTINGLKIDKIDFQGVLFFGIMVDKENNPYLLEYNTRFGDPEIQSISLRLNSDFLSLAHATATKNLEYANIEFDSDKKSICLILAT